MDMIPRISRAQVFDALRYFFYPLALYARMIGVQFHGKYRRVQGCFRGIQSFRTISHWAGYGGWVMSPMSRINLPSQLTHCIEK
jgi:hypothetical protein